MLLSEPLLMCFVGIYVYGPFGGWQAGLDRHLITASSQADGTLTLASTLGRKVGAGNVEASVLLVTKRTSRLGSSLWPPLLFFIAAAHLSNQNHFPLNTVPGQHRRQARPASLLTSPAHPSKAQADGGSIASPGLR